MNNIAGREKKESCALYLLLPTRLKHHTSIHRSFLRFPTPSGKPRACMPRMPPLDGGANLSYCACTRLFRGGGHRTHYTQESIVHTYKAVSSDPRTCLKGHCMLTLSTTAVHAPNTSATMRTHWQRIHACGRVGSPVRREYMHDAWVRVF